MNECKQGSTNFDRDRGAASLEYGLLISLIAGVVAVALAAFGPAVGALLSDGLDVLL
jgi:Flp pilus assembly pilin Flp